MTYCTAAPCAGRSRASSFRNADGRRYTVDLGAIPKARTRRHSLSDLFGISVGALQAFQSALNVTSNNIANANTPGYAKESVELATALPQANGNVTMGNGVTIPGISRSFNQATANQLNTPHSALARL